MLSWTCHDTTILTVCSTACTTLYGNRIDRFCAQNDDRLTLLRYKISPPVSLEVAHIRTHLRIRIAATNTAKESGSPRMVTYIAPALDRPQGVPGVRRTTNTDDGSLTEYQIWTVTKNKERFPSTDWLTLSTQNSPRRFFETETLYVRRHCTVL